MSSHYVLFTVCSRSKPWTAAHVPFLCRLLTEQLCPGRILAMIEPGKLILHCVSLSEPASTWLGSTQRAWQRWGKEEMGSPRKLQQRGIWAGMSNSLFQWHDPGRVFTSPWAALSCAAESVLYSKGRYIYSPFNVAAALVNLAADIMGWQMYSKDCATT